MLLLLIKLIVIVWVILKIEIILDTVSRTNKTLELMAYDIKDIRKCMTKSTQPEVRVDDNPHNQG